MNARKNTVSITAITPVCNEEACFQETSPQITNFLEQNFTEWRWILINSGSTDQTAARIQEVQKKFPQQILVIEEKQRSGFGSALQLGLQQTQTELVYLQPIDVCFPLASLREAADAIGSLDCIVSYRSLDPRAFWRRAQTLIFNFLVKLFLGLPFRHINSALKLYRTKVLQSFPLEEKGWLFDMEILYYTHLERLRYQQIPAPYVKRAKGQSSIRLSTCLKVFVELAKFTARNRRKKTSLGAANL